LQKTGERNYVEFSLPEIGSSSSATGADALAAEADTKHKSFDLSMIVDDNQPAEKSEPL